MHLQYYYYHHVQGWWYKWISEPPTNGLELLSSLVVDRDPKVCCHDTLEPLWCRRHGVSRSNRCPCVSVRYTSNLLHLPMTFPCGKNEGIGSNELKSLDTNKYWDKKHVTLRMWSMVGVCMPH